MNINLTMKSDEGDIIKFGGQLTEPQRLMLIYNLEHKIDIEFETGPKPDEGE